MLHVYNTNTNPGIEACGIWISSLYTIYSTCIQTVYHHYIQYTVLAYRLVSSLYTIYNTCIQTVYHHYAELFSICSLEGFLTMMNPGIFQGTWYPLNLELQPHQSLPPASNVWYNINEETCSHTVTTLYTYHMWLVDSIFSQFVKPSQTFTTTSLADTDQQLQPDLTWLLWDRLLYNTN